MADKSVVSAFDPKTLTEWRNTLAFWVGVAYSNLDTTTGGAQDQFNELIDEAHDLVDELFANEPWSRIRKSLSLAAGTGTLALDYDVRHPMVITETYDGTTRQVVIQNLEDYEMAWGGGGRDTHPWTNQDDPHWIIDELSSDAPPKIQLTRYPAPSLALTGTALCRPYFGLLASTGEDQYTFLPRHARRVIKPELIKSWAVMTKDWESVNQLRLERQDQTQNAEPPIGGAEQAITIKIPDDMIREMTDL